MNDITVIIFIYFENPTTCSGAINIKLNLYEERISAENHSVVPSCAAAHRAKLLAPPQA